MDPADRISSPPAAPHELSPPDVLSESPIELARLKRDVKARLFADDTPPLSIGRFEVLSCIGRGGMGIVYAARDVELGRTVAIKLLREPLANIEGDDQLHREAQALARLSHPNVISVFDVGIHDGQRFIAMEYVRGQSLAQWLESPRSIADVLTVFCDAGEGLHAAHQVGLVHRDFKAHNVLVGDDGRPRVLDFGLARGPEATPTHSSPPGLPGDASPTATCLSQYGELLGTPAYMSPEQHLGLAVDARSDQFSFGVALYDALFGRRPFEGSDLRSLSLAIVRGVFAFPSRGPVLSERLTNALTRALAPRAVDRFDSMAALVTELLACLADPLHRAPVGVRLSNPGSATAYGTEDVRRVLSRAAQLEAGPAGHASSGLQGAEVVHAAADAGLDPRHAQRALAELASDRHARTSPSRVPVRPPQERYAGITTSAVAMRTLPREVSRDEAELIVREVERAEQVRGRVEFLGRSVAWSAPDIELHLDRSSDGQGHLTLWRRTQRQARRKVRLAVPLGTMIGFALGGIVLGGIFEVHDTPAILFGLFAFAATSTTLAFRLARGHHRRAVAHAEERLEYLADRAMGLLALGPSRES